ncbi:hexaprenyl pyrophosphate synthase, mitochondrial [Monosporozyma unispora]|nr:coq1 putative hexaprenyl diphosphate synthase [Kazachstania unispora]
MLSSGKYIRNCYRHKSSFAVALNAVSKLVTPRALLNNPISLVSNEMNHLAQNIISLIGTGNPYLDRVSSYYFETEGKKVRPLLVLLLSRALSEIPLNQRQLNDNTMKWLKEPPVESFTPLNILQGFDKHSKFHPLTQSNLSFKANNVDTFDKDNGILPRQRRLAEIVEMIHTASLLHDDVIDHADTRRGRPSGNVAFTNKMAVLAGDFLLGRATVAISRLQDPQVVEIMSSCIASLVEGEFMQLHNTEENTVNEDEKKIHEITSSKDPTTNEEDEAFDYYLHKSYLKTGSLIAMSLRSTAILSGVKPEIIESCYQFGKNLGLCFQLVDDMLDFTTSSKQMGKTTNVDLKLGISTAPVLFAWKQDPTLGTMIKRNFQTPGDIETALNLVKKYDGAKKTYELAREYRDKALGNIRDSLPESDSRSALEFLTNSVLTRRK